MNEGPLLFRLLSQRKLIDTVITPTRGVMVIGEFNPCRFRKSKGLAIENVKIASNNGFCLNNSQLKTLVLQDTF